MCAGLASELDSDISNTKEKKFMALGENV